MSWKRIKTEYAIKNKWISVRKDHVQLSSGVEIDDFYVIERTPIVHVIAITDDGYFVCEKQYRYGVDRDCLEICAGNVDPNETPLETAKRELLEETGFSGGEWLVLSELAVDTSNMTEISYSILATGVIKTSEPHLEKTEEIETVLLTEEEILSSLKRGDFISALMAAPLWQYFYLKRMNLLKYKYEK